MEELFDVCDETGTPTGESLPRSEVHRRGLWHRSAHIWIVNSKNEILLQRRHPDKETDPGKWDISVAGHLSAGQNEKQAAVREAFEELGLVLREDELELVLRRKKEYLDEEAGHYDREWQAMFLCRRNVEIESLRLQADEVVDVRWETLNAFRDRVEASDPTLVDRSGEYQSVFRLLGVEF